MENRKDLISELHDVIRELTERNYILGTQGESPLHMPLPENDTIVTYVNAINHTFDLAYKAGQDGEPYKLPFSDKYITPDSVAGENKIKGEIKMNNKLQIIKSERFGEITADIYSDSKEMYMTAQQLGECLEYANPRQAINALITRHPYLRGNKFSVEFKLKSTDGKIYDTRVFNEDGIYEIAFLSNTDKAFEFREWVRGILKALRKGEVKLVGMTEYQRNNLDKQAERLRLQKAKLLNEIADKYNGGSTTYSDVLRAHATKELTGEFILPLQETNQRKTYTAEEIGIQLGISANKVGRIANSHNLKVDEYGAVYRDKSPYSSHEVDSFRYYDTVIPVIAAIIGEAPKKEVIA